MTIGRSSTALRRGDIVLVPFPYAELTTTKVRPALVVTGAAFASAEGRITVAGITSNVTAHRNVTSYEIPNWAAVGLKKPSVVTAWLATISTALVQFKVGRLTARDLREVAQRLRVTLEV
jgi:mRNA interferase MazF